ncbi:Uncharacterised protein [Mycobacterium tuberculosis]|nr:Uncharacterised protein [Mycobacterium tuberculosis]
MSAAVIASRVAGDQFGLRSLSINCARMPSTRSCERSDADDTR